MRKTMSGYGYIGGRSSGLASGYGSGYGGVYAARSGSMYGLVPPQPRPLVDEEAAGELATLRSELAAQVSEIQGEISEAQRMWIEAYRKIGAAHHFARLAAFGGDYARVRDHLDEARRLAGTHAEAGRAAAAAHFRLRRAYVAHARQLQLVWQRIVVVRM
ncbi:uncharacterized protein AMSG_07400 [Thecamonas trahens ATCC 50062]|uniref:Uncharacterized protein n=1 Tax=Thecamonas trahens ATCC 50062 TaxID=461836 RepID=A0A0L0DJN8_THETB|nr:hypothetical protein AMSG_07400 [Thecamonas trahens ATCC 50062]KNC51508.1 hypothetical protein AMSG_07400 [Thecamonas trahens ATCC 50062]|eukprot:XP_013755911.1 hypothetical protein AMSG_07400 [Thecamonas trahens ATCC 50062]